MLKLFFLPLVSVALLVPLGNVLPESVTSLTCFLNMKAGFEPSMFFLDRDL